MDYAILWPVARAIPDATSEALTDFLFERIYLDYGAPKEIVTNQGKNLWAPAMETLLKRLNVKHRGTTTYHPRINSAVESFNSTLGKMLTKYLINRPTNQWDLYLDQALFSFKVQTHSTTRFSPFFLLYGHEPKLSTDEAGLTPMSDNVIADR